MEVNGTMQLGTLDRDVDDEVASEDRVDARHYDESRDLPETLNHTVMATDREAAEGQTSKQEEARTNKKDRQKLEIPARKTPITLLTTRDLCERSQTFTERRTQDLPGTTRAIQERIDLLNTNTNSSDTKQRRKVVIASHVGTSSKNQDIQHVNPQMIVESKSQQNFMPHGIHIFQIQEQMKPVDNVYIQEYFNPYKVQKS